MEDPILYLETGSQNRAFEESVLTRRLKGDGLILWQNDNTVVIGRKQNAGKKFWM